MRTLRRFIKRLSSWATRKQDEERWRAEVEEHLALQTADNVRAGFSPAEARRQAVLKFGAVEAIREEYRDQRGLPALETLIQDTRLALRRLRNTPAFTVTTILILALGIAANSVIFSLVNAVLIRPLPFKDPGQIYTLWERNLKMGYDQNPPAAGNLRDWRERNRVFETIAAFDASRTFNLTGSGDPERLDGAAVSPGLFELLGLQPIWGRAFLSGEDQQGRDRVVILSYGLWKHRFGGDRSVVGKSVTIDGRSWTVVGVMPPGFHFPGDTGTVLNIFTAPAAQVWVPLALTPRAWNERSSHYLQVIARLRPGVTLGRAQAEMNFLEQQLVREHPREYIGSDVKLVPLQAQVEGNFRSPLLVLSGAVAFVLLIACANVANLLLARAVSRQREMAVRTALGASRLRLIRQLITESLLLALTGGALGLLLAGSGLSLLKHLLPATFPRSDAVRLDGWVLAFTILVSIATGVLFGLAPALQSSRAGVTGSLKEGERGTEGLRRNRVRSALIVGEVALALILLNGTGLMLRSFIRLHQIDPGFRADQVLTMELSLPEAKYPDARKAAFFSDLLERVRTLPSVQFAGAIGHLPLVGDIESYALQVEGRPALPNEYANPSCHVVMPGYFEAMKIRLVRGRYFDARDGSPSRHVLIVNEVLVHKVFPGEDPVGKRLRMGFNGFTGEIVGVVENTKHLSLDSAPNEEVYTPYLQAPYWSSMTVTIRTTSPPLSVSQNVRELVSQIDKDQPVSKVRALDEVVAASVAAPRFRTLLLGLFGGAALCLGALGIYGVMSHSVSQRQREIGIRMALGATRPEVVKLAVTQGLGLTLAGITVGLLGAVGVTRILASMLYEVRPTDPFVFAGGTFLMTAVALLASYIPARRATMVDPVVALRYE